jgi:hypothetical protein
VDRGISIIKILRQLLREKACLHATSQMLENLITTIPSINLTTVVSVVNSVVKLFGGYCAKFTDDTKIDNVWGEQDNDPDLFYWENVKNIDVHV